MNRSSAAAGLARVRRRLARVPVARVVFDACLGGIAELRPLGIVALGSLAGGASRPDVWSDLDLGVVLRDRRRSRMFRRRIPEIVGAAGRMVAAAEGPGAGQWVGLVERDGVLVKVDVHLAGLEALRDAPFWVPVHDPGRALPVAPRGRRAAATPDDGLARAAVMLWSARVRLERGDPLEVAALLGRAREALAPAVRQRAGLRPGGLRGLWQELGPGPRRRLGATWPRGPAWRDLLAAIRALGALGTWASGEAEPFARLLRPPHGR